MGEGVINGRSPQRFVHGLRGPFPPFRVAVDTAEIAPVGQEKGDPWRGEVPVHWRRDQAIFLQEPVGSAEGLRHLGIQGAEIPLSATFLQLEDGLAVG
jgi:hypothetical protein